MVQNEVPPCHFAGCGSPAVRVVSLSRACGCDDHRVPAQVRACGTHGVGLSPHPSRCVCGEITHVVGTTVS